MRHCLQIGCLILGILCFLYYIGITVYAGIRTSLSWLWILVGLFLLLLWRLQIRAAAQPEAAMLRYVIRGMFVLLIVGIVVIALVGSRIVASMRAQPEAGLDYVIVLGAQVRGEIPSRALRRRLDRALEYVRENPGTVLILSGGQGPDEGISEAECMRRYLTEKGIQEDRMLLEAKSTNTRENLAFSGDLLDKEKDHVGLLTNNFHVYRAMMLARRQGYAHVSGIPASADPGMQPHNVLREVCGVLAERALDLFGFSRD